MDKLVTIKVTQEHIDRGIKADCEFCPVALAAREVFNTNKLKVNYTSIHYTEDDEWDYARITEELDTFMHAFDVGNHVEPQEFIVMDLR